MHLWLHTLERLVRGGFHGNVSPSKFNGMLPHESIPEDAFMGKTFLAAMQMLNANLCCPLLWHSVIQDLLSHDACKSTKAQHCVAELRNFGVFSVCLSMVGARFCN